MKISVNIQSYKRAGKVDTLGVCKDARIWVHEFEAEEYKKKHPTNEIVSIPDEYRNNLPKVKNFILSKEDAEVVVIMDDDISKIGYFEKEKICELDQEDFLQFIEKYSFLCQEWGFKLWGINVNPDKQCYREYTPFSTVSYVSSSFTCYLKGGEFKYDERFVLKEDYDMTIQQCNKYRGVLRINKFFYVKKSAENIGGCAVYRNVDKEIAQIKLLQKKWGNKIVKMDSLNGSKSHSTTKRRKFDINPILNIPIKGV